MFQKWRNKRNLKQLKDAHFNYLFAPYEGDEVVVFDTETTGLDTKNDALLSIGAVIVKDNKILTSNTFECFFKYEGELDADNVAIHNIRPIDLANGVSLQEGLGSFLEFVQNRPLVGYYLEFDVAMVNKYLKPWLGITLPHKQIEVSERYLKQETALVASGNIDLRFTTILNHLQIPNLGKHNAVNDAIMTAMIYLKLKG